MTLHEYLKTHCERGACQCGKCVDAPANPSEEQPKGHTADLIFFQVRAIGDPSVEGLIAAIKDHCGELDLLDGKEHSYLEIGAWIGDQGYALMLMGLGSILGLWHLMTPRVLGFPEDMAMKLAGAGMISIIATTKPCDTK